MNVFIVGHNRCNISVLAEVGCLFKGQFIIFKRHYILCV